MSALSQARDTKGIAGGPNPPKVHHPIAANVKIYQGSLVMLDAGYAKPGAAATGKFSVGMATQTVDNTGGAAGALLVPIEPGIHRWGNSTSADLIEQDDVGKLCYIVDDQTVGLTDGSAARSIAGTIYAVDASGVWVIAGLTAGVDGTTLTAEIASRQAITTDLASTANAKGASLIGIEDAGSLITATTVEGALAEKKDGRLVANTADDNVIGGIPVCHIVAIADGVTADKDITLTHKTRITDVVVVKTAAAGGASDTITVKNGATAITNAMDINVADKTVVRAGTIDDAQHDVAAAGTLRITKTKASAANVACLVYVFGVRRA
jgi:hypothetical protein